jgi:phage terminase large subunit-like protein
MIIAFAHSLTVPAGKMVQHPVRLREFQLKFVRDVYNPVKPNGLRQRNQAVMSIGRRGGKTLLAAVLVLAHLVGPMKRPNSTLVSAATTRDQAKLLFRYCVDMVKPKPLLMSKLKILANTSRIIHKVDGSVYRAISSDAGGGFGMGMDVVVYDELAQAPKRSLYDMLMTSLGSQVEPLMLIISTQAPANDHILSELIDYGEKIRSGEIVDPTFTAHVYRADEDCDLLDEAQWLKANPALGDYRDLEEFRSTMRRAKEVPSLENAVRNLYLNQRVAAESPFLSPNVWMKNAGPVIPSLFTDGRPVFGGLDLAAKTDLSAMILCAADDDLNVHLLATAWTPGDTLMARAARDRAPYDVWRNQGFLHAVPGSTLDYDFLAMDIAEAVRGMNLVRVSFDRWRIDIMRQAFARIGFAPNLIPHGQGFKDMSPAVDAFEELAIAGKLRHGDHPILRWCVSNTFIEQDAAGNRKPTKARSWGRIDLAVAGIMAVSAMKCSQEQILDFSTLIG